MSQQARGCLNGLFIFEGLLFVFGLGEGSLAWLYLLHRGATAAQAAAAKGIAVMSLLVFAAFGYFLPEWHVIGSAREAKAWLLGFAGGVPLVVLVAVALLRWI